MRKFAFCGALLLLVFACSQPEEKVVKKTKKKFEMYNYSQMAALMRQMYAINEELKIRIESGEDLGEFPKEFEQILNAEMTKKQKRDDFFNRHADLFLSSQRKIYENPADAKIYYIESINSCIECHKTKCPGPVAKIKKLQLN